MKRLFMVLGVAVVLCLSAGYAQSAASEDKGVKSYDFGDMTSQTLTTDAWQALKDKDYDAVYAYTNKCIELYKSKALVMQAGMTGFAPKGKEFDYWALNDVGTCYFIKGKVLKEQGKNEEARNVFNTLIKDYSYSQCWDPKGWFWKPAQGAEDTLKLMDIEKKTGKKYDFGDTSSQGLTTNAWQALDAKDYDKVYVYADECIQLYKDKAKQMQAGMTGFASKKKAFDYWALNDVGTCYFIKGKALMEQGKREEARKVLNTLIKDYSYSQCWDPKGWFWKPAQGAGDIIKLMDLEKKTGKKYDFGDYSSMTLTVAAWGCLDKKDYTGVDLYTHKCISMYGKEAAKMQNNMTEYLPKAKAFNAWALNDVGTCYFILGESLMAQSKYKEANKAYHTIIDKFSFAQCWDPRGWFWKPAVGARGKINKIIAEHGDKI